MSELQEFARFEPGSGAPHPTVRMPMHDAATTACSSPPALIIHLHLHQIRSAFPPHPQNLGLLLIPLFVAWSVSAIDEEVLQQPINVGSDDIVFVDFAEDHRRFRLAVEVHELLQKGSLDTGRYLPAVSAESVERQIMCCSRS